MTTPAPVSPPGPGRDDAFRLLGALGGILTLITALMLYFGWRRSEAQSQEMGIDVSLFGYTSQDYVMRSISSLYLPLLVMSGIGVVWVWGHGEARRRLGDLAVRSDADRVAGVRWATRTTAVAIGVVAACMAFTVAVGNPDPWLPVAWVGQRVADRRWLVPLTFVLATVVACYGIWARRLLTVPADPNDPNVPKEGRPWASAVAGALAGVILVLGMVWMLEEYAAAVGRGYARQLVQSVDQLPRAILVSGERLGIEAPGVKEASIGEAGDAQVRFRTTGLRLLARTPSKILLVHDGWTPRTGVVIVLPDSDQFTWQFTR
jgi:hypothetical protein